MDIENCQQLFHLGSSLFCVKYLVFARQILMMNTLLYRSIMTYYNVYLFHYTRFLMLQYYSVHVLVSPQNS